MSKTIKNLIKEAKKKKEHFILYCKVCKMDVKIKGTPIRVKAMRKEFDRQHLHKISLKQKIKNIFWRWFK